MDAGAIRLLNAFEKAFVAVALFLSTDALAPMLFGAAGVSTDVVEGNPVAQAMWLAVYAVAAFLVFLRWKWIVYAATRDKLLLLLVGVSLASVLWSVAPEVTLRREIALLGTTLVAAYAAVRFGFAETLRLLGWALGIAAVLSLATSVALPSYGISDDPRGAFWQGVFAGGKNVLGRVMALGAVVFLLLALSSRRHRLVLWAFFGLSAFLLVMSNSVTSMAVAATVILLLPLYGALRWPRPLAASFIILAVVAAGGAVMYLLANSELVLAVSGRDLTFTYRADLWEALLASAGQRPWLGYGYGAFWLGWSGPSAQVWLWNANIGLEAVHAHNGYLDLWLNLGLLGVAAFALSFVAILARSLAWIRLTSTAEGLWPMAALTFLLLYNFTESSILIHNNIFWILYVTVAVTTAVRLPELRESRARPDPVDDPQPADVPLRT